MIEDTKYWYIKNHKLFEQLTNEEVDQLCIISNMKNANKNDAIFFSDSEIKKVFILKVGTVKICREDSNGKEIISELLTEGDIFGHISSTKIANEKAEYAIVISDNVKLCFFEQANFLNVLKNNPNLSIKYTDTVNEKLLSFKQKYEDLIFKDVETRVADFFKKYAKHHGKINNGKLEMEMMLTHQEIADYTASSRQSVTSIVNNLVGSGKIIYEGRKKVIIPDLAKL